MSERLASKELPIPQDAVEAAARAVEDTRWDHNAKAVAEAALRAAFEATGMKVERMPGLESRRKGGWQPRKLPDMYRLVSGWHSV